MLGAKKPDFGAFAIVLVNLIPLIGFFYWNWTFFSVVFVYWLEGAFAGFFGILKLFLGCRKLGIKLKRDFSIWIGERPGSPVNSQGLIILSVFFFLLYALFLIMVIGPHKTVGGGSGNSSYSLIVPTADFSQFLYPAVFIFLLDAFVLAALLLGNTSGQDLIFQGYNDLSNKILVLHVSIIAGAFLSFAAGALGVLLVLFFVSVKTAVQLLPYYIALFWQQAPTENTAYLVVSETRERLKITAE